MPQRDDTARRHARGGSRVDTPTQRCLLLPYLGIMITCVEKKSVSSHSVPFSANSAGVMRSSRATTIKLPLHRARHSQQDVNLWSTTTRHRHSHTSLPIAERFYKTHHYVRLPTCKCSQRLLLLRVRAKEATDVNVDAVGDRLQGSRQVRQRRVLGIKTLHVPLKCRQVILKALCASQPTAPTQVSQGNPRAVRLAPGTNGENGANIAAGPLSPPPPSTSTKKTPATRHGDMPRRSMDDRHSGQRHTHTHTHGSLSTSFTQQT